MYRAGLLEKLGRGLYWLADLPPLDYPDLVQVAMRIPSAVICLISALAFHNLTTAVPHKVYIALPQSVRRPRIKYPPLEVVSLSEEPHSAGIEQHRLDGVSVPIYGKAKTVSDCFKFRNKIGKDVALDALKDYVQLPDCDVEELLEYARMNRVENVMRSYLEAVLRATNRRIWPPRFAPDWVTAPAKKAVPSKKCCNTTPSSVSFIAWRAQSTARISS